MTDGHPTARPVRRALALAAALTLVVGAAACSQDDEDAAIPGGPDDTGFTSGAFDDIPQVPGSEPIGVLADVGSATTQSFAIEQYSPERVMEFYRVELLDEGWDELRRPTESETGIWRGDWGKDGRRLEISASTIPTSDEEFPRPTTQYDLVLNDDLENNPVFTGATIDDG